MLVSSTVAVVTTSSPALPLGPGPAAPAARSSSQPRGAELDRLERPAGTGVRGARRRPCPRCTTTWWRTSGARRGGRRGRRPRPGIGETLTAPRPGSAGRPPVASPTSADPSSATATLARRRNTAWRGRPSEDRTLPSGLEAVLGSRSRPASARSGDQRELAQLQALAVISRRLAGAGLEVHQGEVGARLGGSVLVGDRPPVVGHRERFGVLSQPGRSRRCGSPSSP